MGVEQKKNSRGVSMITLVITIIVMIILAMVVFSTKDSINEAGDVKALQELSEVRKGVSSVRLTNAKARYG